MRCQEREGGEGEKRGREEEKLVAGRGGVRDGLAGRVGLSRTIGSLARQMSKRDQGHPWQLPPVTVQLHLLRQVS